MQLSPGKSGKLDSSSETVHPRDQHLRHEGVRHKRRVQGEPNGSDEAEEGCHESYREEKHHHLFVRRAMGHVANPVVVEEHRDDEAELQLVDDEVGVHLARGQVREIAHVLRFAIVWIPSIPLVRYGPPDVRE